MPQINYISFRPETPAEGYWDQCFISDIICSLPDSDRKVFVVPGAYQASLVDDINMAINTRKQVLVFISSDEEGKFPVDKLEHPDMVTFVQYQGTFPLGYTPKTRPTLKQIGYVEKTLPWFYAGQINHIRRAQMRDIIVHCDNSPSLFFPSEAFSTGLDPAVYFDMMAHSKAVPCPPGNVTQDSFRVYEALESGAVPIVDRFSAQGMGNYWERLFPHAPFPIISSYKELPEAIDRAQDPNLANQVFSWWMRKKMTIRQQMKDILDINEAMTVVISTSPIPSHPDSSILDATIASIRHHTNMDIILTFDSVRPEQEYMRADYMEFTRKALWKCNFEYENVIPLVFSEHVHQAHMMREALKWVHTPLVMYVEHDTPLVTDEPIDWASICLSLMKGDANVIRFHFEAQVPEEHKHLMLEEHNLPNLLATKQWSQRPHIARTDFYRDIMQFFSDESNCFIEDFIYGKCVIGDWNDWRLFIYEPDKKNIKRSLNLDGRGKDKKFDEKQIW